jgi:hypothetical protein
MTHDEIINAWNKQADYMNKWDRLGEDEKLEWAMKLEREACAKVCDELDIVGINLGGEPSPAYGYDCAKAIRARGEQA